MVREAGETLFLKHAQNMCTHRPMQTHMHTQTHTETHRHTHTHACADRRLCLLIDTNPTLWSQELQRLSALATVL